MHWYLQYVKNIFYTHKTSGYLFVMMWLPEILETYTRWLFICAELNYLNAIKGFLSIYYTHKTSVNVNINYLPVLCALKISLILTTEENYVQGLPKPQWHINVRRHLY